MDNNQRFSGVQRLWLLRGTVYVVIGLFTLVGVFLFANWQIYLLVGLGSLFFGASWFWWAYSSMGEDRERRRSNASPETAEEGLEMVGWGRRSNQ